MTLWLLTYADGQQETVVASDLRAALMVLPNGRPAGCSLGHPDDVVRAEVAPADAGGSRG